jgi:signal transduction histidine kinase
MMTALRSQSKTIAGRFRPQQFHFFLVAGFLVAVAAIVLITALGALRQNQQYFANQTVIAQSETAEEIVYLSGQLRQMVYYQDAYDNSVKRWNQGWIEYQFGEYQDTMGNSYAAMLNRDGKLIFLHAPKGEKDFNSRSLLSARGLPALFQNVRRLGVRQPTPIASGVVIVGKRAFFAVAAMMTPEAKSDLAAANRSPISVFFFRPIDKALFLEFSAGFDHRDLHVVTSNPADGEYRYHPLADANGVPIAWLKWLPRKPGSDFMRQVALPLVIVLAILMLIQIVVIGRWLALQHAMLRSQAEARAAQEQSRLKSVFLGTISHELRTPLNAIIGYAEMLCCQIFGPLGNPRNAEYVRDIRTSGHQLLKIVNDLIEIARIEARDTCGELEACDATLAARTAIGDLQQAIVEKSLLVKLIRPDQPVICRGSHISLTKAIERIVANAVRHSPAESVIAVELKNEGQTVVIEIRDSGEGIAPETLDELKRPFGHFNNHLVSGKGFGFGIPIAKGLVQLMRGSFDIESSDTGTTVRMTLPADTTLPADKALLRQAS